MKTGNTWCQVGRRQAVHQASMEPGHEDREYPSEHGGHLPHLRASMEPGHEDREYHLQKMDDYEPGTASMEPGHEDREYGAA